MNRAGLHLPAPSRNVHRMCTLLLGAALLTMAAPLSGCSRRKVVVHTPPAPPPTAAPAPLPAPGVYVEEGIASWYGVPFHGRRTASGEIYDMEKHTAAHRILPFDTIVRVTNLKNGRQADVRINDRGPFVEGRIIDLSLAAARALDMVTDGIVPVRIEILEGPHELTSYFTVQVGAFRSRENALELSRKLQARYQPVFINAFDSPEGTLYRVRIGQLPSESAARELAARIQKDENLAAFVVRIED